MWCTHMKTDERGLECDDDDDDDTHEFTPHTQKMDMNSKYLTGVKPDK